MLRYVYVYQWLQQNSTYPPTLKNKTAFGAYYMLRFCKVTLNTKVEDSRICKCNLITLILPIIIIFSFFSQFTSKWVLLSYRGIS